MAEISEADQFKTALDTYLNMVGDMAYADHLKKLDNMADNQRKLTIAFEAVRAFSPPADLLSTAISKRMDSAVPGPNPVARNGRNMLANKARKALIAWYEETHAHG